MWIYCFNKELYFKTDNEACSLQNWEKIYKIHTKLLLEYQYPEKSRENGISSN